jgi:hypothetical protein
MIVKHPPVVDVSYCYVCILRKKSNDFNIFLKFYLYLKKSLLLFCVLKIYIKM